MSGLTNKRIVLGVSGSIAAYKAPDIVRRLQDLGADVRVIVTDGGREFVSERSFQTILKTKFITTFGIKKLNFRWVILKSRNGLMSLL